MTDTGSLILRGNVSRLTPRDSPLLCTAGVGPSASCHTRAQQGVNNGQLGLPVSTARRSSGAGPGQSDRLPKL
jgi:hypothetical protein